MWSVSGILSRRQVAGSRVHISKVDWGEWSRQQSGILSIRLALAHTIDPSLTCWAPSFCPSTYTTAHMTNYEWHHEIGGSAHVWWLRYCQLWRKQTLLGHEVQVSLWTCLRQDLVHHKSNVRSDLRLTRLTLEVWMPFLVRLARDYILGLWKAYSLHGNIGTRLHQITWDLLLAVLDLSYQAFL